VVAQAWLIDKFLPGLLKSGMSGNAAGKFLASKGLSIKRQTFQSKVRYYKGIAKKADALKYTPVKNLPGFEHMSGADKNYRSRFTYVIETKRIDVLTGREVTDTMFYQSNRRVANSSAIESVLDNQRKYNPDYDSEAGETKVSIIYDTQKSTSA